MACEMPILASASGETKRIIEEAQCGVCCDLGDIKQLQDAIEKLKNNKQLKQLGLSALSYCSVKFERNKLFDFIGKEMQLD